MSKNVKRFFYVQVPEECLLIVQTVLYLKKVNWSNIVTKCPLHPNRNFEFFWVFKNIKRFFYVQAPEECLLIVQTALYLKKVNWSNIVTKCPLHPNRNFEFFRVYPSNVSFQSHLTWFQSHLAWNNIFHLVWKNSQNSRAATPFPSIR